MHHIAIISIRPSMAQPIPTHRTMHAYAPRQPPAHTMAITITTPTATLMLAVGTTCMEELSSSRATTDTNHARPTPPTTIAGHGYHRCMEKMSLADGWWSMSGVRTVEMGIGMLTIVTMAIMHMGTGMDWRELCMVTPKRKLGLERRGKSSGYSYASFTPRRHRQGDADVYIQVLQLGIMIHSLVIGLTLAIMSGSEFGMCLLRR